MPQLLNRLELKSFERDVEEELTFHIDLLTRQYVEKGLTTEEARAAALKRFGNLKEVRDECVRIGERNSTSALLLKVGLSMVFLLGVLIRVFIPGVTFRHLADLLMMLAVLGRLFMYVRSLHPSLFLPKQNTLSRLSLNNKAESATKNYDQPTLSPLERVIADK